MASRAVTAKRLDLAVRLLLKGHSSSRVVAELAEREGISLRQSRRLVGRGYKQIVDDLEEVGLDRKELTAQMVHMLQEGMAKALDCNHISAMVGACRELRELVLEPSLQPKRGIRHG